MKLRIKVPATTSNLGSGFDTLGLAVDLFNEIEIVDNNGEPMSIDVIGKYGSSVGRNNLLLKTMKKFFEENNREMIGYDITEKCNIPPFRGLGSSATAVLGGLISSNEILHLNMSDEEIVNTAVALEGHPDNVLPAFFGGLVASSYADGVLHYASFPISKRWRFCFLVPNSKVSTHAARSCLPGFIPYKDAVFNLGHVALLLKGLMSGDEDYIREGVKDRLHQQYRRPFNLLMDELSSMLKKMGAVATFLSGSGSTVCGIFTGDINIPREVFFKERDVKVYVQNVWMEGVKIKRWD